MSETNNHVQESEAERLRRIIRVAKATNFGAVSHIEAERLLKEIEGAAVGAPSIPELPRDLPPLTFGGHS